jgi:hypothetical protein
VVCTPLRDKDAVLGELLLQGRQALVPASTDLVEPSRGTRESARFNDIEHLTPVARATDQSGLGQGVQMFRQSLAGDWIVGREFGSAQRTAGRELVQHPPAGGVGEGGEYRLGGWLPRP